MDRYRLLEVINRGALGHTFRAEDIVLGRHVVVRVIEFDKIEDGVDRERVRRSVERELLLAARLDHPSFVTVYDLEETADALRLVTELVEGRRLLEPLSSGELMGAATAQYYLLQVADALQHAHDRGVVHSTLTPASLIVDPTDRIRITTFGIGMDFGEPTGGRRVVPLGASGYAAPEYLNYQTIDSRADQFSLTAIAYHLLTGFAPFGSGGNRGGDWDAATLWKVLSTEPPSASTLVPSLGPDVDRFLCRGLSKRPEGRFRDLREWMSALSRALFPSTRTANAEPSAPPIPARIGRFLVQGCLGSGGMGTVYRAHDPRLHRNVAIKALNLACLNDDMARQLVRRLMEREAVLQAGLLHPGFVKVLDVAWEDGAFYIIVELVEGTDLEKTIVEGQPGDAGFTLSIVRQAAEALDHAHARQVIHRDVKPPNILLARGKSVKLTDFGIAKDISATGGTLTQGPIGTARYMSPEQVRQWPLSGASDQWSLAVVAYRMLTGHYPFDGEEDLTVLYRVVHHEPVPVGTLAPQLGPAVDDVMRRGLAKEASQRFRTCTEFAAALAHALPSAR